MLPSPIDPRILARIVAAFALGVSLPASAQDGVTLAPATGRPGPPLRFAVIGDYGVDTPAEAAVAALVQSLSPAFLVTVGDNNYPEGSASTIDDNIGRYWHDWIGNYAGSFGSGAAVNAFFPSLGNHDWIAAGAAPYLAYFTLPGNERYYDFVRGPVHFYAIDSDVNEPDGVDVNSVQADWLRQKLAAAHEPFQLVYFHHSPYSSTGHGDSPHMQWPFRAWGADLVITGHDHTYERTVRAGFPYVVAGLGGAALTGFGLPFHDGGTRYDRDHGAVLATATPEMLKLELVTIGGFTADVFTLPAEAPPAQTVTLVPAGAMWRYRDTGVAPSAAWIQASYDDSGWSQGPAQLGYGDGDESTVVSYGPDAAQKRVTTWFRRTFGVADPSALTSLVLEMVRDDGVRAYLNGVEVVRNNLPSGTITASTLAADAVGGVDESAFFSYGLPTEALVSGTNVLAVEIHQSSVTSSDISFDLRLTATTLGARLVAAGSTWKYRDSGVAPHATWKDPTYDDTSWSSGPAQLGYGDGDEATLLSFGNDASHKPITTWFRRSFSLQQAPARRVALLRLLRDDGAAVYLNGTEVFRQSLPRGALAPSMTAEYSVSGNEESAFFETWVDASLLHAGVNVIAVELHQNSAASSDISFDLELVLL